jgi:imidazolonepropionase-like amidohydrolase
MFVGPWMNLLFPDAHDVLAGHVRDLTIADGRVSIRPTEHAQRVFPSGLHILPGLIDAHAHLVTSPVLGLAGYSSSVRLSVLELKARVVRNLQEHLAHGVLAVRDVGDPTGYVSCLAAAGDEALPRVQAAGRFIAAPGRYLRGVAVEVEDEGLATAATAEAGRNGGWIKLIGDFPDRSHPTSWPRPGWSLDAVRVAVAAAHAAGARVAMHATTSEAIELALDADVDSIEHGCQMTEAHLRRMSVKNVSWVPTLAAFRTILNTSPSERPVLPVNLVAGGIDRASELLRIAVQLRVPILCGSDGAIEHGAIAAEVLELVLAGMSPREAIASATLDSWIYLGYPNPTFDGAVADLIAFETDPLLDPSVLGNPSIVVRAGRASLVKSIA